ncbi:MAG TPA: type II toxin-antitoxin system PemK/MazF family toxin [Vicinamibacteria bacterium]|nr:type II toxin-antitoxin system PemK/MazF family toxin [Vicinamibacteria bacterium]
MDAPQRGRIYWISLDKRRPALVLSPDYRNQNASDVIVIPCSTRLRPAPTHVLLRRGQGGVTASSVLKCEQITTLPKGEIRGPALGAALPPSLLRAVERAVLRAVGVPIPLEASG